MSTPVKIAHVLGALGYGGVESMALHLLRRLPTDKIRSSVYWTGEEKGEREDEFAAVAADFRHCPYHPPHRADFIRRLAGAFSKDSVDGVLAYAFGNHAWVCLAARLAGVRRCYVSVQGSPLRDAVTRRKCFVLAHLARPVCIGEIAASHSVRDQLVKGLRLPPWRVHVIENACAVGEIAARAAAARSRRAAGGRPVVLMVARMDDAKDQPTLIRACARLIHAGFPVRLRLAGDGPRRAEHEHLCRQEGLGAAVDFLGSRNDVPELLGASDVAVLATHTEGLPNVLIEAMSARTPVVATDLPVCREVVESGRCGLLVPPRDPEAMAAAIRRLLEDSALRAGLTEAGFRRAAERYDIKRAVEKYAALLTRQNENRSDR